MDEAAGNVDDMEEWLAVFNTKLRHMREDIEAVSCIQSPFFSAHQVAGRLCICGSSRCSCVHQPCGNCHAVKEHFVR